MVHCMMRRRGSNSQWIVMCGLLVCAVDTRRVTAEPPAAAVAAFDDYVSGVEARLAKQRGAADGFLAGTASGPQGEARLRAGELIVDKLTPAGDSDLPGAMLHHWRGTAFVPGARAADFERLMKDFGGYPRVFAPEVMEARVTAGDGDQVQASMRVRQRHVITVVMDTEYDVRFARVDALRGYSVSRSTRIAEIEAAGTRTEHPLSVSEEHGFLWRLNTYWSYEQRDGGLYLQVESVSLTRSIPTGLGWLVRPFVESVPRESLEFTLRAVFGALRK
jgi:hypothetical protein